MNKNHKAKSEYVPGMDDFALPGLKINKTLQADHIVPMDKITRMEGFNLLTQEQQINVLNYERNFIPLSESSNKSKGSKTFIEWTEHKDLGIKVNPIFRERMIKMHYEIELELQQQIDQNILNQ